MTSAKTSAPPSNSSQIEDTKALQEDLTRLGDWNEKWQMLFHESEEFCTIRIHRKIAKSSQSSTTTPWEMRFFLPSQASHNFLVMEIHKMLSWKLHIKAIAAKANKTLGFIDETSVYALLPSESKPT